MNDITIESPYSAICGYTQQDLETVFADRLEGVDLNEVKKWYNGYASGLSRSFEEDVMNICRTSCIPPIVPEYESLNIDGKTVARISIPKGEDKPYYTSRNKYFIRVGSTKRIASREEMLRLFEASGAIHYDLVELDKAGIKDLDMGQVAEYFTRYHFSFLEEPEEEQHRLMLNADILGRNFNYLCDVGAALAAQHELMCG